VRGAAARPLLLLLLAAAFLCQFPPDPARASDPMDLYRHLNGGDTVGTLVNHPAFKGFGRHLLPRDGDLSDPGLPLSLIGRLLPYHGSVDVPTVLASLNHMIDDVSAGHAVFYDFYTARQRRDAPDRDATGLFLFRGEPGAPFAMICPGGGFSYVGSVHEGFPYARELSGKGYNAFVLRYRVGQGAAVATADLAAALTYVFGNARSLGVGTAGYSLWGSSAGARMAADVVSRGAAGFGGAALPAPAAVVMAYTGHSGFTEHDPPAFATVSADDPVVNVAAVEKRARGLRRAGIDAELLMFRNAGHGFGLGIGTDAEGWFDRAVLFWERHLPKRRLPRRP
jgi:acetyl esterase/lipase